ncbi:MAG: aldehyde dehydrogenase family protein [Bacteroidia bacterium]|nr:aldehyde dehydrogenase family protein [Bacteroidia bacterium]
MQIINPATEVILATIEPDAPEIIQTIYQTARKNQPAWARLPLSHRIAAVRKFEALLEKNANDLAQTLTQEMGKPLWQSHNELKGARTRIQFFIDNSEKWLAEEWMTRDQGLGEKIVYEPLGVIGNISAWNYPYLVGVNVFVPALIAGNAVLYKPSEYTTLTGLKIEQLLHEAGIPTDIFQVVTGGKEAGEALLELPLDGYFFTGSYKTGKYIYEKVAHKMVPCQLELGGKDPLYINADNQNIEAVAIAAAEGAFYNSGQSCCAVERIYVHKDLYKPFVEAFVAESAKWKVGDPMLSDTQIGPLVRKEQVTFLQQQVGRALLKGARIVFGEERWEGLGYFFIPTVVTDVNHTMQLMMEESFGPVIGIQKVKSDEEAVKLMLDTPYGLTAAVYSDTYESAAPIFEQMNTGTVYWNCCDRVSAKLPWSGRQHSGLGSTLSYHGIRAFVQPKAYHLRGKY